jgi:hypothetical protein
VKPGPELDALVAEKVLGWNPLCTGVPDFSTDIADAWQVVEWVWPLVDVGSGGGTYRFQLQRSDAPGRPWVCELSTDPQGDFRTHKIGRGETAPHAICLAALRAVEG